MKQIAAFALLLAVGSPIVAQNAKKEKQDKGTFTIHIRELTDPERVFKRQLAELDTVLDAVSSLTPMPEDLKSKMDMWIVRTGKDGKTTILAIDWAGIVEKGRTETNFLLLSEDKLIIQARFPK
jgi:hypothetical protein